jgi:uncharacterized protein YndB with AHSA1/START domain
MQDKIERKVTINAPKERVYSAIADPKQITQWFPDTIDGELKEGEQPVFHFRGHGKSQIYVVAMRPHDYFAYRWVPGASNFVGDILSTESTLVEFNITETDGVSTVSMTESGFSKLPKPQAEAAFKQNSGGWEFMLGRLEKVFSEEK